MTERHAAIHTSGRLAFSLIIWQLGLNFFEIENAFLYRAIAIFDTLNRDETAWITHDD